MLVELATSLISSQVVSWPPPITQLEDEALAVATCSMQATPPPRLPRPWCRLS